MKNKPAHKKTAHRIHRTKSSSVSERTVFWYTVIVFSLLLMVFANAGYKLSRPHVLGASTVLLADNGGDGGSGNSGISGGSSAQIPSPVPTTTPGVGITPTPTVVANSGQGVSGDTMVDCVGPDGKHFVVDFHACQELNQQWGHSTFNFTPLSGSSDQQSGQNDSQPTGTTSHTTIETPNGKLEVQVDGNKRQVNLENKGLHVEFKQQDNGIVSAVAKQEGGKEVKLSATDALKKMNNALKNQDVEISSTQGGLAIKKGDVEAQTHFPLSVDPTTGQLTVTTPAGTKVVAVLPDKAVQNLLATGVFSGVSSQASNNTATQLTQLTDVNGTPAYQVQGVLSKKLLGLFPMSFTKTAYVSALDGQTIDVQQSPLTSFLQSLSF